MAGCAAGEARILVSFSRCGIDMTVQAVGAKLLQGGVPLRGGVIRLQGENACLGGQSGICGSPRRKVRCLVCLRTIGKAQVADRAGIGRLDAGHHPLDVIATCSGCPAMAFRSTAGFFHHAQVRWVGPTAHAAVCQVSLQRQPLAAMAQHAAKGCHRMRGADLR
jgi:hypothetical protein